MATGILTPVVQYLVQLLDEEVRLLGGVKDEVKSLQRELSLINTYLEDSEGKRNVHPIEKVVVGQIREVAYEAEDVIDIFILNTAKHGKRNAMGKLFDGYEKTRHTVAKKIECLNKEINKIFANRTKYASERAETSVAAESEESLHRRRREVEEDDVVGFDRRSKRLLQQLTEGDPKLDVISIIGMGGLGKTTLAKKIYNKESINSHFDCCLWVCVQDFSSRELLFKILKETPIYSDELTRNLQDISEVELKKKYLVQKLFNYLQGKRYLVVMDDIWKPVVWDEVRSAFPDNSNGSRILITSRIKGVALIDASLGTPPYDLPFLNKNESWELFRKKLFLGGKCPPELETLGRQLAEGCGGLPLSILELGSLLASKDKTHRALSRYVDNVNSFLPECKKILALSYTHLPRNLKLCFLYLGVFPRDFEIPARQLIQLWIAEEFISQTNDRLNMEDVAKDELEKLIDGSLVQVASKSTVGGAKTCRIHDILQDLCISESKEDKFLEVLRDSDLSFENQFRARRLSIHGNNTDPYISLNQSYRSRSLLFFSKDTYNFDPNHWKWILESFKLLRVLNFGCVDLYAIPASIEEMIHLRYLRIKSNKLKVIPTSICNLTYLETLDMRGTFLKCLPSGIWKLRRLRNLYVSGPVKLPDDWKPDFTTLWNLQVLSTVSLNPRTANHIVRAKLPNVRKLGLWFKSDQSNYDVADVLKSIVDLGKLRILKIINYSDQPLPNSFSSTITKITLRQVCLRASGFMLELGTLPNLQILKLQH